MEGMCFITHPLLKNDMTIPFKKKVTCNTIDFLYNKEKSPPTMKIDSRKIAATYDELGIVILKPIIDKLTFGFSPTEQFLEQYDPTQSLEGYKKKIAAYLYGDAAVNTAGMSKVTGIPFMKSPYNSNLRYQPPSSPTEGIIIQVSPKKPESNLDFIKFNMNPSRFNDKALSEFRLFIEEIFQIVGKHLSYEAWMMWTKIYHMDVAIDILGARPSDLVAHVLKGGKPFPCKSHSYNSSTGRIETLYLNAKAGKSSSKKIYDKRVEQIEAGKDPVYGDCLHSRYESSVKKTAFYKIAGIQNPCSKISVKAVDYKKFKKLKHGLRLFIHKAIDRTLEKALEKVPAKHKPKYKQAYNDILHNIWDAEKIWESHWKNAVKSSGMFPK